MGFEEGKKRLAEALLERSLNGHEFITCRHLLQESLPQFVKDSIIALAKKKLKAEKPISWNFSAGIDFDDDEVRIAGEKLLHALLKNVRLERKEVENCFHDAVRLQFDLLLRPIQSVETIFFHDSEKYEKSKFISFLEKTAKLPFIQKLIEETNKSDFPLVDRLNYKVLSQQVQEGMYSCHHKEFLFKEFRLLLDLFSIDRSIVPNYVDVVYIEEFLISRGLFDALNLVKKKSMEGKKRWLREDFEEIFTFLLKEPGKNGKNSHDNILPQNGLPKIIYNDDFAFMVHRQKIERQPPGPYPSIFECIDDKDWKNFVRKLFQRSELDFTDFLKRVDKILKWREAKQLIDWELEKRRLDPYSKEAVRLGDLVFARFFSNGKYS